MIFTTKPTISEAIIDALADEPIDTLVLFSQLEKELRISKQGFYRSLRDLLKDEVVTKNKQMVFLSPVWVNKVGNFIHRVNKNIENQGSQTILHLAEGDTMVFRFKSITDLYLLWTHYFFIFSKETDEPVVFFNSHNFWALLRSDIENEMYLWIKENNKKAYSVIGHNTLLDKNTSAYITVDYGIEIAFESSPSVKETIFPAVFGDYVMSTILDKETVKKIDLLYKKYQSWEPLVQTELEKIISEMRRSKVVIERNKKKAEKLRKSLLKYFMFYKSKD